MSDIKKLQLYTSVELKAWLEELGCKTSGNKNELIRRLIQIPEERRGVFLGKTTKILNDVTLTEHVGADADACASNNNSNSEEDDNHILEEQQIIQTHKKKNQMSEIVSQKQMITEQMTANMSRMSIMNTNIEREENNNSVSAAQVNSLKENENELLKWELKLLRRELNILWEAQLQSIRTAYNLDDNNTRALISNKLNGKALKWLHTRNDLMTVPIETLINDMGKLFEDRSTKLQLKRIFEARRWQTNETFEEYFYDKTILAGKLCIEETELLEYIVEGIPDYGLCSQAKLQCFRDKYQLLEAFHKISLPKPATPKQSLTVRQNTSNEKSTSADFVVSASTRCYNCNSLGHVAAECRKPKREPRACYVCAQMGHRAADCLMRKTQVHYADAVEGDNEYSLYLESLIDTGSPISFIRQQFVPLVKLINQEKCKILNFCGINKSHLQILGQIVCTVLYDNKKINLKLFIVANETMSYPVLLGRDFLKKAKLKLVIQHDPTEQLINFNQKNKDCDENTINDLMNIEYHEPIHEISVNNSDVDYNTRKKFNMLYEDYVNRKRPDEPEIKCEMKLILNDDKPFQYHPRRLSYHEKQQVESIIDELMRKKVVRPSNSEYASPIVLIKKKTGDTRLCVDFRTLNKVTLKDNYPLPLIDDLLDRLA
ncbi:uncharacterized protein LOC119663656, partial [Teleopsis dalmanni]|uniref:uncharacterized protein LOC119663656 n=1 Tax=Teleopsis dalmanni TaxID=139649 RepID=UPI0018CD77AE